MNYLTMSKDQLQEQHKLVQAQYDELKAQNLSLDMSRGKPVTEQLDVSMDILDCLKSTDNLNDSKGVDTRNYGGLDGIPECKELFAQLLQLKAENVIIGGASSLNLMYDTVARSMLFGVNGSTPWCKLDKVKFLCPSPGYDRHFAICETFGIEMITIPMNEQGPDMDMVEKLVGADDSIKGIWCVPMYANPTGITYSDEVVTRFAKLKPKASDFRIYWDNAYCVHHLSDNPDKLLNIYTTAEQYDNQDIVNIFTSTSKITFSGAGVSCIATSPANVKFILSKMTVQTISYDKVNQLRHVRYFGDVNGVYKHMKKHQAILEPKFKTVIECLDKEIAPTQVAKYTKPKGGYFVSVDVTTGSASRVGELCKQAGVTLTTVGATYPYNKDPLDQNIRLAPTYPSVSELDKAMQVFCCSIKLAGLEHLLG